MATKNHGAGGKKTNVKTTEKHSSLSRQEKKEPKQADLTTKIKNLEDDNKRLSLENVMFKQKFDLREIIKALYTKGVTEVDAAEMAKDTVKTALEVAENKHSAEKTEMEKKYKREIEKLRNNLPGEDQLPTKSNPPEVTDGKSEDYLKSLLVEKQQLTKALDEEKIKHANCITELESGDSKHSQETDKEIAKLKAQNKVLEREVGSLKAEKDELNNNIKTLTTEKECLKKKVEETEVLLRQKETEITNMKENVTHVQTRSQDTVSKTINPDDIHILMTETMKEKDEVSREKDALLAEKQKKDAEIKTLQDENKALKQTEEKNKNLNEKLKKLEEEQVNLKQQVTILQRENDEAKYRLKESQSPSLSSVISANDNKAVQQLKDENERLLTRLSEMAGAQMTVNNPNIADLSDAFRPTKLSEEYSQLYDNMWTDAYEEHGSKKEEDIIQMLRRALLDSYKFCEKVCREFTVQLTNSSLSLPNSKPKTGDIPIVYKKQLQDMKKSFGVFLRNDVKESYWKQNTIEGGEKTKNYIDACVELCWLMVIQEPQVVIETPASKDSAFDSDTYRTYTKIGTKVDFVVWPALRLHQNGPLLTKGVAQGKN